MAATLEEFGLKPVAIQLLRPLGAAVAIQAQTDRSESGRPHIDRLRTALQGEDAQFEGIYLEITSPLGEPLIRASTSYRTGNGRLWLAPGAGEDFGADHGGVPEPAG